MKNTKIFTKKLEKKFNVEITSFHYFSGNSYKASFDLLIPKADHWRRKEVLVGCNETYENAIEKALATQQL